MKHLNIKHATIIKNCSSVILVSVFDIKQSKTQKAKCKVNILSLIYIKRKEVLKKVVKVYLIF